MGEITMEIPFPVSLNRYYRHVGSKVLISKEGRKFIERVEAILAENGLTEPMQGRVRLTMEVYPPDNRRRDLDNLLKVTQDTLTRCRQFNDDSQIDELHVYRRETMQETGGSAVLTLTEL